MNRWLKRILRTLIIAAVAVAVIVWGVPAVSTGLAAAILIRVAGLIGFLLCIISLTND